MDIKGYIEEGRAVLGIELGSTRIKAVLIGEDNAPIAGGEYDWENKLENGFWTYSKEDIVKGVQGCYASLLKNVQQQYQTTIKSLAGLGFSAMMHGYLAFDKDDNLLVPFRTWRNSCTGEASEKLTALFNYNIPQRWSIAHLYQAILNKEPHVGKISHITTLAGYIHYLCTGEKVLGVGDASGMFPIDINTRDYNKKMTESFNKLVEQEGFSWKLEDILPSVKLAGEKAGVLTEEGAKFLDVSHNLLPGVPLCPPEGDAGTGMVATNSVAKRTGNVSAGTSIFGMIVLEKELSKVYPEIDLVTTPDGSLVGMAHANNCTSDLNAWVGIFKEFAESFGIDTDMNKLYSVLYNKALEGAPDCGGVLAYGYLSGEPITGCSEGRPMVLRTPNSDFSLANLMRANLFTALGALKVGMDILLKQEHVRLDKILGHGGLFKTKGVGQGFLAAALDCPVTVMKTASEGGPWGMAVLASYMVNKKSGESLGDYLEKSVFGGEEGETLAPKKEDVLGMDGFIEKYKKGIAIEQEAVKAFV